MGSQRARDEEEKAAQPQRVVWFNRSMTLVEDVVYASIALVLSVGSAGLLYVAARDLVRYWGDERTEGLVHVLDTLLLVFIFVELLYAVRLTLRERQVLVEPFILVGVLAAIKEIVVLSVEAADQVTDDKDAFTRSITEIGVLTALIVGLGVSALLLRRKEREPEEHK